MESWASGVVKQRARGKISLRRSNNLAPTNPPPLAEAAAQDSTRVLLKSATNLKLTGRVVKGSTFQLAGITGTYTVLIDAEAVNGRVEVFFSPALPQLAALGTIATFTQTYIDIEYPVVRRSITTVDKQIVESGDRVYILPYISTKPEPEQIDQLDGIPILRVQLVHGDDGPAYYRCHLGARP
jgi:hypothetical protein